MGTNHMGRQSIRFPQPPVVRGFASVAGKKEREGPLGDQFTATVQDTTFGEKSWERAERRMQQMTLELALEKAGLTDADLDAAFAGDLLNQCIGSSFSLRNRGVPTLGLYGACSTMAESLLLAAMSVSGGYARTALAMTSSHFASSERQYRFPLGYGGQRTPTSQWTVTGAGAVLLGGGECGIRITAATIGSIVDRGICDANNMGAAMAPAAFATLRAHFDDLHCAPEDYDAIVTGDLGKLGSELLHGLLEKDGIRADVQDCGVMIFDAQRQDVHCGGSGCGCSASVLCGPLLSRMERGELRRLLFCGTGALRSPWKEYDSIYAEADRLLRERGVRLSGVNPLAKYGSMLTAKLRVRSSRNTTARIAEMLVQGNTRGMVKSMQNLRAMGVLDPKVSSLSTRLLQTEQANIEEMKHFL